METEETIRLVDPDTKGIPEVKARRISTLANELMMENPYGYLKSGVNETPRVWAIRRRDLITVFENSEELYLGESRGWEWWAKAIALVIILRGARC